MNRRPALLVCLALPLFAAPAEAARVGDPCTPWVNQGLQKYFAEEEKVAVAKDGGAAMLCPILGRQKEALEIVVQTLGLCPADHEDRKLLPEVESMLADILAVAAENNCPEPAKAVPQ